MPPEPLLGRGPDYGGVLPPNDPDQMHALVGRRERLVHIRLLAMRKSNFAAKNSLEVGAAFFVGRQMGKQRALFAACQKQPHHPITHFILGPANSEPGDVRLRKDNRKAGFWNLNQRSYRAGAYRLDGWAAIHLEQKENIIWRASHGGGGETTAFRDP